MVTLPDAGALTLDELAALAGPALVGTDGMARRGARFPLLVKVIDAAEWLSLQVHPSDELAEALYGPGAVGKAEAWVVLDAGPDDRLITGPRADIAAGTFMARLGAGSLGREDCEARPAIPGEILDIPTGTIHAIGAGTYVYEIEQPSDLTFRISDWGRPATAARPLHLAEASRALEPGRRARVAGTGWRLVDGVLDTWHFRLEIVDPATSATRAPAGRSPEVVTAIGERARARGRRLARGDRAPRDGRGACGGRELPDHDRPRRPCAGRERRRVRDRVRLTAVGRVPGTAYHVPAAWRRTTVRRPAGR